MAFVRWRHAAMGTRGKSQLAIDERRVGCGVHHEERDRLHAELRAGTLAD